MTSRHKRMQSLKDALAFGAQSMGKQRRDQI
jgi:hypothetical protein